MQSCGYRWESALTEDGEKVRNRVYKKLAVAEAKRNQSVFNYRDSTKPPPKYLGTITSDTIHNYTFIQFDSIRVYLYDKSSDFKEIFTSGLVSGQTLYSGNNLIATDTAKNKWDIWGWKGKTVFIGGFELLTNVKSKPTERRFKFYAESYPRQPPLLYVLGDDAYFLELTNDKATRKTDLHTFLKNANVTLLTLAWHEY